MSEPTGIVFDLQRFCTHDGPGIRSVLFLKGCPLHCLWCHNPESILPEPQLKFNRNKCIDCKKCVGFLSGVGDPRDSYKNIVSSNLEGSHELSSICPAGAWEVIGREVCVSEIADELASDTAYYDSSGGGVTLSGGEAMAQFEFTLALLKELKNRGIHTALETSGASSKAKYKEIAEYVDLFLWDYKMSNPLQHKEYVGGACKEQLANLEFILSLEKDVALRCIYLKTLQTQTHWGNVVALALSSPHILGVRVLPYHNLAKNKYKNLGKEYPDSLFGEEIEEKDREALEKKLADAGVVLTEY